MTIRLAPVLLAAASLGGCVSMPAGSSSHSLDPLISFANPALCEPSPTFAAFLSSMTVGDANEGFRPGRTVLPSGVTAPIGHVRVKRETGYWAVRARATGRWLGLPVVAIHQAFPEGGDPGDFLIELRIPVAQAEARLRAAGFPARANADVPLREPNGYAHLTTLQPAPGRPGRSLFGCGYS